MCDVMLLQLYPLNSEGYLCYGLDDVPTAGCFAFPRQNIIVRKEEEIRSLCGNNVAFLLESCSVLQEIPLPTSIPIPLPYHSAPIGVSTK